MDGLAPWRAARAIARAEMLLLRRSPTVLVASTAMPLTMTIATVVVVRGEQAGEARAIALALLVVLVLGLSVYMSATLIVTTRREDLYLKRLRTSEASDAAIVAGVVGPTVVGGVLQLAIAFAAVVLVGGASLPSPVPIVVATILLLGVHVVAAIATTGAIRSTEQADSATLAGLTVVIGTAVWAVFDPTSIVPPFTPGGAMVEAARASAGTDPGAALPSLLALAGWLVLVGLLAVRGFRWEPRR